MMADLAMVFHWSPAEMDDMDLADVIRWHTLARDRNPKPRKGGRNG
jgi:hypothetical protein